MLAGVDYHQVYFHAVHREDVPFSRRMDAALMCDRIGVTKHQ